MRNLTVYAFYIHFSLKSKLFAVLFVLNFISKIFSYILAWYARLKIYAFYFK